MHGPDLQAEARRIATWVLDFAGPMYGPHGAWKCRDDDVYESAAAALWDVPLEHAAARPYQSLGKQVQAAVGDQATTAVLLAAALVRRGLDIPVAAALEGYALARRQARAWLRGHATSATPAACLEATDPDGMAHAVVAGLLRLGRHGAIDVDAVHIRAEDGPTWHDGTVLDAHGPPTGRPVRVLLIEEGPRAKLRLDAVHRQDPTAEEAARHRAWLQRLQELDVGLVVAGKDLGDLAGRTEGWVVDKAPRDLRRRIVLATGARELHDVEQAEPGDLGHGSMVRNHHRVGGWTLTGDGPGATIHTGRSGPGMRRLRHDRVERLLRAAGAVLDDPRALPGGGRWQRGLAASLATAAPLAEGRAPLGVEAAGKACADLADRLLRNAGMDPLDGGTLPEVADPGPCVEAAVDAAFAVAITILRIDARHEKRRSRGVDMRGGTAPAGSPKGMPGDIPPLM